MRVNGFKPLSRHSGRIALLPWLGRRVGRFSFTHSHANGLASSHVPLLIFFEAIKHALGGDVVQVDGCFFGCFFQGCKAFVECFCESFVILVGRSCGDFTICFRNNADSPCQFGLQPSNCVVAKDGIPWVPIDKFFVS